MIGWVAVLALLMLCVPAVGWPLFALTVLLLLID